MEIEAQYEMPSTSSSSRAASSKKPPAKGAQDKTSANKNSGSNSASPNGTQKIVSARRIRPSQAAKVRASGGPAVMSETAERIVDATIKLLREEGAGALSTRNIANRANVNQALVHYHFGSMELLMVAVLRRQAEASGKRLQDHYNTPGSLVEKYAVDMDDVLKDDPRDGWGKVWFEATAMLVSNPELSRKHALDQRMPVRRIVELEILNALPEGTEMNEEVRAYATLIHAVRTGLIVDRLAGSDRGHRRAVELLGEFLSERLGPAE
jgi:AcrR family transcriptional regulator